MVVAEEWTCYCREALQANVVASLKVLELAKRCPNLVVFSHISTVRCLFLFDFFSSRILIFHSLSLQAYTGCKYPSFSNIKEKLHNDSGKDPDELLKQLAALNVQEADKVCRPFRFFMSSLTNFPSPSPPRSPLVSWESIPTLTPSRRISQKSCWSAIEAPCHLLSFARRSSGLPIANPLEGGSTCVLFPLNVYLSIMYCCLSCSSSR